MFAFQNISLTAFSVSPTYFENSSGPFIEMKLSFDSVASAFAQSVFEHRGGPCNRIPLGGFTPSLLNASGCFKGHSIHCHNYNLTSSYPPTSLQSTFGTVAINS